MIQSVDRAAGILRALATGTPTLGVTEIADRMGSAKPTVHGLLRTLESNGLVRQDPTGKYSLGPAVLKLGNAYLAGSELRSRSMLRAAALARQVNEAVWVGVLTDTDIMVVHHEFRPDDVVQILEVGASIPWHACALGQAIAAYADSETLDQLMAAPLRPLTGRTHTTKAVLSRVLGKVRTEGYAVENQELNVGDGAIAAAIFDRRGGVAGPSASSVRRSDSSSAGVAAQLSRAVVDTARAISRDLSGRPSASPSTTPSRAVPSRLSPPFDVLPHRLGVGKLQRFVDPAGPLRCIGAPDAVSHFVDARRGHAEGPDARAQEQRQDQRVAAGIAAHGHWNVGACSSGDRRDDAAQNARVCRQRRRRLFVEAAETENRCGEVIGAEEEEVGDLGEFVRAVDGLRKLDHDAERRLCDAQPQRDLTDQAADGDHLVGTADHGQHDLRAGPPADVQHGRELSAERAWVGEQRVEALLVRCQERRQLVVAEVEQPYGDRLIVEHGDGRQRGSVRLLARPVRRRDERQLGAEQPHTGRPGLEADPCLRRRRGIAQQGDANAVRRLGREVAFHGVLLLSCGCGRDPSVGVLALPVVNSMISTARSASSRRSAPSTIACRSGSMPMRNGMPSERATIAACALTPPRSDTAPANPSEAGRAGPERADLRPPGRTASAGERWPGCRTAPPASAG